MKRTVTVSMEVDVTVDARAFTHAVIAAFQARDPRLVTVEDHICAIAEAAARGDDLTWRKDYRRIPGIEVEVVEATVGSEIMEA